MSTVDLSGPVFDGTALAEMDRGTEAVRVHLADMAQDIAFSAFTEQIRVNRGVFLSTFRQIRSDRVYQWGKYTMPVLVDSPASDIVVTSSLAMYGPWLEGTGSRNVTTRFKGYHGFRRAAAELETRAELISATVLDPYIEAVNG